MITIKKADDGTLKAVSTVEFDLGKVPVEKTSPDGKTRTVVAGAYVKSMIKYYEDVLYNGKHDRETFKEFLETYAQFKMLDAIGVDLSPIRIKEDGSVEGVKEGFEVVFED